MWGRKKKSENKTDDVWMKSGGEREEWSMQVWREEETLSQWQSRLYRKTGSRITLIIRLLYNTSGKHGTMRRKIPTLKTASLSPRNNKKKKHPEFILQDQDQDWDQGQNQSFLQRDRQIKSLCVTKTSASIYIVVQIEDTSQATGYSS